MPIVDYAALPEFAMRDGITGKWIASHERGASGVGVLANTVQPGRAAPLHRHEYEEVILVEALPRTHLGKVDRGLLRRDA